MKRTLLILLGLGLILNGCHSFYWTTLLNPQAVASSFTEKLQIGILKNPLQKMDQELAQNFAQTFQLKYDFVIYQKKEDLLKALSEKKIDVAATRFSFHPNINTEFQRGPTLEESQLVLVCLRQLKTKSNCKVLESIDAKIQTRRSPQLEMVKTLNDKIALGWYVRTDRTEITELLKAWYQIKSRKNEIHRIIDRHTLHLNQVNHHDVIEFYKRIETELPKYKNYFKQAAKQYGIPWRLLAAVAYQESHWNPEAQSFTGVRGMMMLTEQTAEFVGVIDRKDAEQSIFGGAKYLKYLYRKIPTRLNSNDRLMLVLASYNVGFYHLKDAQSLAARFNKNPESWNHVRKLLPLLEVEEYYSELKFGQARGLEPVIFAERVRNFYELLKHKSN